MPTNRRTLRRADRRRTFIREWRKYHGLTLQQLCDKLELDEGLSYTMGHISRMERGDTPYTQDLLEALARVLLCEPMDLVVRDPNEDASIITLWAALEPGPKSQLTAMVQRMVGAPKS